MAFARGAEPPRTRCPSTRAGTTRTDLHHAGAVARPPRCPSRSRLTTPSSSWFEDTTTRSLRRRRPSAKQRSDLRRLRRRTRRTFRANKWTAGAYCTFRDIRSLPPGCSSPWDHNHRCCGRAPNRRRAAADTSLPQKRRNPRLRRPVPRLRGPRSPRSRGEASKPATRVSKRPPDDRIGSRFDC